MSARRWLARFLPDDTEPNPLAVGRFCDRCGTRLDGDNRPCPFGCK